jgi:hypothetical protein
LATSPAEVIRRGSALRCWAVHGCRKQSQLRAGVLYDPTSGAFMTRDPALVTTNRAYMYAAGDPLNATDPTGLKGCDWNPICYIGNAVTAVASAAATGASAAGSAISTAGQQVGTAFVSGAAAVGTFCL